MYRAPLKDMQFLLAEVLQAGQLARTPLYKDYSDETAAAVLAEAAKLCVAQFDVSNAVGDRDGARWKDGAVLMPEPLKAAFRAYVDGGWPQLAVDARLGGQGMPTALGYACEEVFFGGNVALMLCMQLSRGAIEALHMGADPQLWQRFAPKLVSGEWSGTMNLTEPQAGSDLGAIRMRAIPDGDHYRLIGQKIFITYGDHDLAENIVHLVLARIEGAPPGVKGISLFVAPKFLVDAAGRLGERNDIRCVSIEHKLGLHASPTCVLAYGDRGGATGYLIGQPNRGLEYMFVMMNAARLGVGMQGVGLAERGYQQALAWAFNRIQGRPAGSAADKPLPIAFHPDVKRMLLAMKSGVEAMRALSLYASLQLDLHRAETDAARAQQRLMRAELLIPIVKGWCTEFGNELVSLAVQVHGGMGYIEETGVAQTLRDVRITAIYEGTTGIQANDLLGRKLKRDAGAAMYGLLDEIEAECAAARVTLPDEAARMAEAIEQLRASTRSLLAKLGAAPEDALAVSVPYLRQCGVAIGGWLMLRSALRATALRAAGDTDPFYEAKQQSAAFYMAQQLPQALAMAAIVRDGGAAVTAAAADRLVSSLE